MVHLRVISISFEVIKGLSGVTLRIEHIYPFKSYLGFHLKHLDLGTLASGVNSKVHVLKKNYPNTHAYFKDTQE